MERNGVGHRLLLLAVEQGLISDEALADALATSPATSRSPWGPEVERLVETGALEPSQVLRLVQELKAESRETDSVDTWLGAAEPRAGAQAGGVRSGLALDPLLDIALDPQVMSWDRYELGDLLGQGGMGCVYRARDLRLERDVALKFLRRGDPDMVRRFLREARVQAQVDHPHVCRVYEVGEVGRHVYIAMQLVDGQGLMEAGLSMTLADKVRVAVDVARAVDAAHGRGLIHRDLKPANVMVERRGEAFVAYVLDFGIAREEHVSNGTETGTVMGTLSYLSPEQARGAVSQLDRRSDVYGLGATFYALLAGCPPFAQSAGPEVVWKVVHEEPRPLRRRDPDLPRDLETVVMRCLEKDPARRYQSAADLADDLERFLNGQPILARRASPAYRFGKLVRRHRAASVAAALVTVLVAAALGVSLHVVGEARSRSALARRLAAQVEEREGSDRLAALLPLHDRSQERAAIRAWLERVQAEAARLGRVARGPVHHALGHGHLLLDEPETALDHLVVAWEEGYTDPADAAALGRAYAAAYEGQLEALQIHVADPELRRSRMVELERRFRDPALTYLRRSASSGSSDEVDARIALLERRWDDALAAARAASARDPSRWDATQLAGEVHLRRAQELLDRGDYGAAAEAVARAGEALAAALQVARSDAGLLESECSRRLLEMEIARRTGQPLEAAFRAALAAAGAALEVNPDGVGVRTRLAQAQLRFAEDGYYRGADPRPALEAAIAAAREAAALDPSDLHAQHALGRALSAAAVREADLGRDPVPAFDEAIASLRRAVELSPAFTGAFDDLGYVLERKGKWQIQRGVDPSGPLAEAVAAYHDALALEPDLANAHNNLGLAHYRQATWAALVSADPGPPLAAALGSLARAVERNPNYAFAHANQGIVHRAMAEAALARGVDPTPDLERARAAFARAAAINPEISWSYPELVAAELAAAAWALRRGVDPGPALSRAEGALATALALNPRSAAAHHRAAEIALARARSGPAPSRVAAVERGLAAADRALRLNPSLAEAHLTRAELQLERARQTANPTARARAAAQAADAALQAVALNPRLGPAAETVSDAAAQVRR